MPAFEHTLKSLADTVDGKVSYIIRAADGSLDVCRDETRRFPSASIIKLTILWTAFRKAASGELALDAEAPMLAEDVVGGYGALKGLHVGIAPTLEDLCVLMTDYSDNIATNMLIDRLGFESINADIAACGLESTVLGRKMMDAEARQRGLDNFTTPRDIVSLLEQYRHSAAIPERFRERMLGILHEQFCNNFLSHYMPPDFRFAHKTGDLPGSLHDTGILYSPAGKEYYVAVMCTDLADNIRGLEFLNDFGAALFRAVSL